MTSSVSGAVHVFNALDAAIKAKGTATQGDLNEEPETSAREMMIYGIRGAAFVILPGLLLAIWLFFMQ
jgi:hypothetical protein